MGTYHIFDYTGGAGQGIVGFNGAISSAYDQKEGNQILAGHAIIGQKLSTVQMWLNKQLSPTGDIYCAIYDSSGTLKEQSSNGYPSGTIASQPSYTQITWNFAGTTTINAGDRIVVDNVPSFSNGTNYLQVLGNQSGISNVNCSSYTTSWHDVSTQVAGMIITTPTTVPDQVTGLTATTISGSEIDLSWTAPNNGGSAITGYKIERESPVGGGWSTLVANTGNTNVTYNNTGLTQSTQYNYRVSAINAIGTGSASTASNATTTNGIPAQVTGLSATVISDVEIDLSWTAPGGNGFAISGYKIERESPVGGGWSTLVANTGNTNVTYNNTGLTPSTQYNYRVSAINSVGTGSASTASNGTTQSGLANAPTSLTATTISVSEIDLSWVAPSNNGGHAITGYKIERESPVGGGWSTLVANTGNTNVTYNDTGLTISTQYNYRVSAINLRGAGAVSNSANALTELAPLQVTGLTTTAISDTRIDLSWTAPNNQGSAITGYKIERESPVGGGWSTIVANTGNTNVTYSNTGLTTLTQYNYRVSAINAIGTGSASTASNSTTMGVPSQVTGLTLVAINDTEIDLSWTAPNANGTPITGYKIERESPVGGGWSTIVANTGNTNVKYNNTGLNNFVQYNYRVSAINAIGTGSASTAVALTINIITIRNREGVSYSKTVTTSNTSKGIYPDLKFVWGLQDAGAISNIYILPNPSFAKKGSISIVNGSQEFITDNSISKNVSVTPIQISNPLLRANESLDVRIWNNTDSTTISITIIVSFNMTLPQPTAQQQNFVPEIPIMGTVVDNTTIWYTVPTGKKAKITGSVTLIAFGSGSLIGLSMGGTRVISFYSGIDQLYTQKDLPQVILTEGQTIVGTGASNLTLNIVLTAVESDA